MHIKNAVTHLAAMTLFGLSGLMGGFAAIGLCVQLWGPQVLHTALASTVILLSSSARADGTTPTPDPANLVHLRVVGRDRQAPPIPYGKRMIAPLIFEFADHRVKTLDEFKAAILTLPQGTELCWSGNDCVSYTNLPLSGPVTALADVKAFCAAHGINFHYTPGGY